MTFVSDCLIIDTILCDTKQTCLHPLFIVLMIVTFWRHSPADPLTNNVLLLLRLTTVMMKFQSTSFVKGTAGWGRWQVIEPKVSARRLPWAPEIDSSVSWRWSRELPLLHPRSRSPCSMHEQIVKLGSCSSLLKALNSTLKNSIQKQKEQSWRYNPNAPTIYPAVPCISPAVPSTPNFLKLVETPKDSIQ